MKGGVEITKPYDVDYVIYGFIAGDMPALAVLVDDILTILGTHFDAYAGM